MFEIAQWSVTSQAYDLSSIPWTHMERSKHVVFWPPHACCGTCAALQPLRGTEILISQPFSEAGLLSGVSIHSPPQVRETIAPHERFSHSSFRACSFAVLPELLIAVIYRMIGSTSLSSFVQFGILLEEITFPFPSCSDIRILKFSRIWLWGLDCYRSGCV